MKLFFIFYDRPNYFGGPIVNARRLLPELVHRNHQVYCLIFYSGGASPSLNFLENHGVVCYAQSFSGYTETHIYSILNYLLIVNPDVFIPNLSVAGWFASRWARKSGIPTIAICRSDDEFHWAMIDEFVTGNPDWAVSGLVCVSEGLYKRVKERHPRHTQLCIIPSGVPLSEKKSDQSGPLKLVYVGRLVQMSKRILDLVDALAKVLYLRDDVTAALIGDGPDRQAVQEKIDGLNLSDRIKVIGTVPSENIQDILIDYHVLVLLSDYEGMPGAVMDGMAAGLVPVCLDIPGGVRELVIHETTGLLVNDRSQSFVDAIIKLIENEKLRRRLAENAKKHIAEKYSLEIAADRWIAFCQKLLEDAGEKKPLILPSKLFLPPVRKGLDREDKRKKPLLTRAIRVMFRSARNFF